MSAGLDWVSIPAGSVHRGTPAAETAAIALAHAVIGVEEGWIRKEAPRSIEAVAAFVIARTPVQLGRFRRFAVAADVSWVDDGMPDDHPVDDVTWPEAEAFCDWLSQTTGAGVRLPTELEWERAARGDDTRAYPWGDAYEKGRANLADLGLGHTTPVGSFPRGASPFGVLDLAGNVDEWTGSLYAPYPGAPAEVPMTEDWATDPHITRGGGYRHDRDLARCARRHGVYPPFRGGGFRLVRID